jgi:hypothetical protein
VTTAEMAEQPLVVPPRRGRLNQPWRALIALAELVVAGAALWAAYWCWPRGIATITLQLDNGTQLVSHRYFGDWLALAIALGTIAALLALDALRQVVLAVKARPRRAANRHRVNSGSEKSGPTPTKAPS